MWSLILAKQGSPDRWYQCGFSRASILFAVLQSLPVLLVAAQAPVRVCVVGWMGAVLCGLLSVVGFCASARDIHGEEGMILGL